jgi:hypothetical protein
MGCVVAEGEVLFGKMRHRDNKDMDADWLR